MSWFKRKLRGWLLGPDEAKNHAEPYKTAGLSMPRPEFHIGIHKADNGHIIEYTAEPDITRAVQFHHGETIPLRKFIIVPEGEDIGKQLITALAKTRVL